MLPSPASTDSNRRGHRLGRTTALLLGFAAFPVAAWVGACSATADPNGFASGSTSGSGPGATGTGSGGGADIDASTSDAPPIVEDPKTCEEAAAAQSYVGCDFWPTVTDNMVRPIFDYAVVVANAGDSDANYTVTRLGQTVAQGSVPANGLSTVYLPWVDELKSTVEGPFCSGSSIKLQTVNAPGGAYHLSSSLPVTVYQFNAIEYAPVGGPPGKDWVTPCDPSVCILSDCFSYTNDASLLLPSTAMTGTYRVTGVSSWTDPDPNGNGFMFPSYFVVTGTQDGTQVAVTLSATGGIAGGGGVANTPAGGSLSFTVNAGDVVQLISTGGDLSGSLVKATAPVQVIAGIACSNNPSDTDACDHLEETVFPAETLGKHYYVTPPTGPEGGPAPHTVRIYGNVDGTALTYPEGASPPGAPSTINAGQVVDLGLVTQAFEIVGDHEFVVGSVTVGAAMLYGPNVPADQQKGDPDLTLMTCVEQYRKKYVFLAPTDYDVSFVDVVQPTGATVTLDGQPVTAPVTPLSSGFGIARIPLGPGNGGAHLLTASEPVSVQVMGYGSYTSYQYPGGLNLGKIAPVPPK